MQLSELQTALKRYGFDDNDPLTTWINAAVHMIENEEDWDWLEAATTLSVPASTSTLTLPSDFFKPVQLVDTTNQAALRYWDVRNFSRNIADQTQTGQPEVYTVIGTNTIQLYPVPDASLSLKLIYERQISDMVNGTDLPTPMPARYHYAIVHGAAYIALQAENEEDRSTVAKAEFDSMIDKMRLATSRKDRSFPDQVQDVQGYGGDW